MPRPSITARVTGDLRSPTSGRARPGYSPARLFEPLGPPSPLLLLALAVRLRQGLVQGLPPGRISVFWRTPPYQILVHTGRPL